MLSVPWWAAALAVALVYAAGWWRGYLAYKSPEHDRQHVQGKPAGPGA